MNYYEHHLGDYDGNTAHLSWIEDCAYRRVICLYYRSEKPIPTDIKQVCRLVRATSKQERDAVQQVLSEFFDLRDDGWHNDRCDEEIARYLDKQEKAKRSANARWNKTQTHSEGNANASPNAMRTHSEGNAHHTPDTRHQTPDIKHTQDSTIPNARVGTPAGFICKAIREAGISNANPSHPTLLALIDAGATEDEFKQAAYDAIAKGTPTFAYTVGIVKRRREEAAKLVLHKGAMPAPINSNHDAKLAVAQHIFGKVNNGTDHTIIDVEPAGSAEGGGKALPAISHGIR